jgi:hypothetical protein
MTVMNGWHRGALRLIVTIGGSLLFLFVQLIAYAADHEAWRLWAAGGFAALVLVGIARAAMSSGVSPDNEK